MNFIVELSDAAQAETDAAFLRHSAYDPDFAGRWLEGLTRAIATLETFPRRHERVSVEGDGGRETRRLLYRQGRMVYRIIFTLTDADDDGEEDTVRVLQIRPATQIQAEQE